MGLFGKKQAAEEAVERVGVELGLAYESVDSGSGDPLEFYLLPSTRPCGASNVLSGRIGNVPVRTFEWTAQRPLDPLPELAGFPSRGGGSIRMQAVIVELPFFLHTALVTRGAKAGNRGLPHMASGNAWLDEWFVCHTRSEEVASALGDPSFVHALAACPDGTSVELTARTLLAVHPKVPAEELAAFVRAAVALAEVIPAAVRRPEV